MIHSSAVLPRSVADCCTYCAFITYKVSPSLHCLVSCVPEPFRVLRPGCTPVRGHFPLVKRLTAGPQKLQVQIKDASIRRRRNPAGYLKSEGWEPSGKEH